MEMKFATTDNHIDESLSGVRLGAQTKLSPPGRPTENSALGAAPANSDQNRRLECESRPPERTAGSEAFTFWRGRVGLYAILKALQIGQGDSVVIPGYTCFAVPSAICFTGAQPLYADIEPATFNVSLGTIESAIRTKPQARIKAIVIQHTYGIPAETYPIVSWARERGIATIEDCAHVWGSRYSNGAGEWIDVGTLADAAFFSSQWTKPFSTGLGGWVEAWDPKLREQLQRFRAQDCVSPSKSEVAILAAQLGVRKIVSHPRIDWAVKKTYQALYSRGLVVGTSSKEELLGEMPLGYAKRMSSFQEWLLHRLKSDNSTVSRRRRLKGAYDAALESAGLPVLHVPENTDPVLLRYPVRVEGKARALAQAKKRGLEIGDWYTAPVDRPDSLDAEALGYQPGTCLEGERASREVINLPMDPNTTEESVRRTVEFVRELDSRPNDKRLGW